MKIIHAPAAAEIVDSLETHGLYVYLQPNASRLMRDAGFRARYLKSFAGLREKTEGAEIPGWNLAALIRDYLEDYLDWDAGIHENYRNAFIAARKFVLPMNPPRAELERAVRLLFAGHGITLKKSRLFERGKGLFRDAEGEGKSEVPLERPVAAEAAAPKRSRRRRPRRRNAAATPPQTPAP
jgi:poly(A) polymerase